MSVINKPQLYNNFDDRTADKFRMPTTMVVVESAVAVESQPIFVIPEPMPAPVSEPLLSTMLNAEEPPMVVVTLDETEDSNVKEEAVAVATTDTSSLTDKKSKKFNKK